MSRSNDSINVLVVGAFGNLGSSIVPNIVNNKQINTFLITRESTKTDNNKKELHQQYKLNGAQFIYSDVSTIDVNELATILKQHNISTVLSLVGAGLLYETQIKLVDASISSGTVKLFIPSEFGFDVDQIGYGSAVPLFDQKLKVAEYLAKQHQLHSNFNYLLLITGAFTEYVLSPFFGIDKQTKTITVPVHNNITLTTSTFNDISHILQHIITNKQFYTNNNIHHKVFIGTATTSYTHIYNELHALDSSWQLNVVSKVDIENAIKLNEYDYKARFQLIIAANKGTAFDINNTYNHKYAIETTDIKQVIHNFAKSQ